VQTAGAAPFTCRWPCRRQWSGAGRDARVAPPLAGRQHELPCPRRPLMNWRQTPYVSRVCAGCGSVTALGLRVGRACLRSVVRPLTAVSGRSPVPAPDRARRTVSRPGAPSPLSPHPPARPAAPRQPGPAAPVSPARRPPSARPRAPAGRAPGSTPRAPPPGSRGRPGSLPPVPAHRIRAGQRAIRAGWAASCRPFAGL